MKHLKYVAAVICMFFALTAAAAAADISETAVIADFSADGIYEMPDLSGIVKSEKKGLSSFQSGEFDLSGTAQYLFSGNYSEYTALNFWAYNAEPISDTNLVVSLMYGVYGDSARAEIPLDWTGWKKHTVILKDMTDFSQSGLSDIFGISLKTDTECTGKLYIDRIWFSDMNPGYLWADMSAENSFKSYSTLGSTEPAFAKDTQNGRMYPYSAKWVKSLPAGVYTVFYNNASKPVDVSGYSHATFAIYSNKDTSKSGTATRVWLYFYPMDGTGAWFQYRIDVNWQGWQYFSVPLSDFESKGAQTGTWSQLKGARLNPERVDSELELSFDNIVFTDKAPSSLEIQSFSVEDGAVNVPEVTRKITAVYNNALSEFIKDGAVTVKKNGELLTEGFVYGTCANTVEVYFESLENAAEYEISVSGAVDVFDCQSDAENTVKFTVERSRKEKQFAENVNASKDSEAVLKLIADGGYEEVFGVTEDTAAHISSVIWEQKPYDSFDSIIEMSKTAVKVLSELNECDAASLADFLSENSQLVLYDEPLYEKYKGHTSRQLFEINQNIVQSENFKTFGEFRAKLSSAVENYVKQNDPSSSNVKKPSGGSSGGSGGGGGRSNVVIPAPVTEEKTPVQQPENDMYFTDMDNYDWAQDAVCDLLDRGVVSKDETKLFRPGDFVTRAEFIKLLTVALEFENTGAECSFADVPADCWYYKFAAAAQKSGIVTGDENNMFSGSALITREDAAVIAYRAMGDKLSANTSEIKFSDGNEISDYASEAVSAMSGCGIINGDGSGRFVPKGNATRAEAAKIIYELIKTKGAVS